MNPMEQFLFLTGSFISLFSIVNPIMAAPVFISLTSHLDSKAKGKLAWRAAINVFGVLLAFYVAGTLILGFFGISIDALRIAGGIMILNSSFGMLNKKDRLDSKEQEEASHREDIAFSPLAMPLMSGPGAIAVLIGMATESNTVTENAIVVLVILLVSLASYVILRLSEPLVSRLGETLMKAFVRIMGFILLGVGVQFTVNGIRPILVSIISQGTQ